MGFMDYLSDLYASLAVQSAEAEEQQQDDSSGKPPGRETRNPAPSDLLEMFRALVHSSGRPLTRDMLQIQAKEAKRERVKNLAKVRRLHRAFLSK